MSTDNVTQCNAEAIGDCPHCCYASSEEDRQLGLLGDVVGLSDLLADEERLNKLPDAAVHVMLGATLEGIFSGNGESEPRFLALLSLERLGNSTSKERDAFLGLTRTNQKCPNHTSGV